ncbi:protein of unknown function [Flexibacter flexilis DSM 6793]|uniref:DUF4440 domain-containing protein n=1 Tax=Flexibacter flexilis DSM 6793 TaxID=927664 RepID=A0A1I1I479_9BACT|nr:nuclear transport factor 2 family protein [Flexibacter flexilis]SFC28493.1 protein of unknown function [Flexibacter flexilis DSM 6793]
MKKTLFLVFALMVSYASWAQPAPDKALRKTILTQDSLLFNVGFNTCNIEQFDRLLADDFEFYHDKDSISDRATFLFNIKNGLCASPKTYQSRRELMPKSTEIYPLYKKQKLYGAIQVGVHKFYENINGQKERYASVAKFTHVWLLQNGEWKLSRSLSYDHIPSGK